ncbi:MAG: Mov34/MPN/PAD-1 family protein [Chloroflexota bacterium]|nr:Mov34/MPN/PAD-1 family protein [Chloroflexota bacterium]
MVDSYLQAKGQLIQADELAISKAQELARVLRLEGVPFVQLVECRRIDATRAAEVVVFDTEVQLGQHLVNDIRKHERIATVFWEDDRDVPETLALRTDFPLVPHLNLREEEFPRSLCLFDRPYSELKLSWTVMGYVERVREWLALTARGELHADDQPLEPFLLGTPHYLLLPFDLFEVTEQEREQEDPSRLYVYSCAPTQQVYWHAYVAQWQPSTREPSDGLQYVATSFLGASQPHGLIRNRPRTLRELHDFLLTADINLLSEVGARLQAWKKDKALLTARLIIIVALPKTRHLGGEQESVETWAFASAATVGEVGEELGLWVLHEGSPGTLLGGDPSKNGGTVELRMLNPVYTFDRAKAAQLNGLPAPVDTKIAAIGLGALGSQLFVNLLRVGYGQWMLLDRDLLLPHNLGRNAMFGNAVGYAKVEALSLYANTTVDGAPMAGMLVVDVMDPGESAEVVVEVLSTAAVILDMAASVPVARYLARDVQSRARRVSLFLNPTGTDLVLLAEDSERELPLDALEMQYYRALIHDERLSRHMRGAVAEEGEQEERVESAVRYGLACRDVSAVIPQDLVALHAAIGARGLRAALAGQGAVATVWRVQGDELEVERVVVPLSAFYEEQVGDWLVCADSALFDKVGMLRDEKLPNETGGVLVGTFDTQRRIIYVVDALRSPDDSVERPTVYIRGWQGLTAQLQRIKSQTGGALRYVGEWHSHPAGHTARDSDDDRAARTILAQEMAFEGLPTLQMIVGDNNDRAWYIAQL